MPINTFFAIVAFYLILDSYTYFGLKSLLKNKVVRRGFSLVYIGISCWILHAFYVMYGTIKADVYFRNVAYAPYLGIALTALISKFVFTVLMLAQDIFRSVKGVVKYTLDENQVFTPKDIIKHIPTRRRFLTLSATAIAGIPLSTMWYGLTKGKYNFVVNKVKLAFKDLPEAFEGFTIAQFSDLHAGGLDDKAEVQRGLDLINQQNPDLILFTGDLVNSVQEEVNPFMEMLTNLQAKQGKYAVLGNHDYHGAPWENDPRAKDYWDGFSEKYKEMGFDLLNNEHVTIDKDGQNIKLVGVENWSIHDWFPQKGDLDKALDGCKKEDFCVLMSHDPIHWGKKVLPHAKQVHLTLSGHTHGSQFGLNLPNFKWSPVKYRYKHWMGLYEKANQYLYVNRGFGYSLFPGRIGMWPEITVFELTKAV